MRGIEYLVDDRGRKRAVVIDLKTWGKLWEDIYDAMISESREGEPGIPWADIKAEMDQEERAAG